MNRCTTTPPLPPPARARWRAWFVCALLATLLPAAAQAQSAPGAGRSFPQRALRGILTLVSTSEATLNGQPIRLAPGLRLFSPQNALVMAHPLIGQSLRVNYLIEVSTGMLHTVWILTENEAAQPRKGSAAIISNIVTHPNAVSK
ncbi:hypothetical protein D5039_04275 [Verminephrobacter aporrectodeae subsp. tuberculatae]|uniref:Uncharacterized protein n=1 Tax=Verminephrobacter aporrectodeae subsp. tuberculatae TaxID=1110392 RepID=A0ABT3KQ73_9BURK|nr:hypothetical protein [Verminephrobacter aporrectodeae]MCW5320425.1 hypothetical protein [Verminephrobacter aporrectodeae subsp. tuberculatae]